MSCTSPGSSSGTSLPYSPVLTESALTNHNRRINNASAFTMTTSISAYSNHNDHDDEDSLSSGEKLQPRKNNNHGDCNDSESSDDEPVRPDLSYLNLKREGNNNDDVDKSTETNIVNVPATTTSTTPTPVTPVVHSTLPSSPRSPSLTRSPSIGTPEHTVMRRSFVCTYQKLNRPITTPTSGASITTTSTIGSLNNDPTILSNSNSNTDNITGGYNYHNESATLTGRLSNAETLATPALQALRPSSSSSSVLPRSTRNQFVAGSSSSVNSVTRNEITPSLNNNNSNTVSGSDFTSPMTPIAYDNNRKGKGKARELQGQYQHKDTCKIDSSRTAKEQIQSSCSPSPGTTFPIKRASDNQPPAKKLPRQEPQPLVPSPTHATPRIPDPTRTKEPTKPSPKDLPPGFDMITFKGKQYIQLNHIKSGGSSRVYKVMSLDHIEYALKDIMIDRFNASKFDSYVEEVTLLQQLQGNDCVIRLYDFEVCKRRRQLKLLFEYGEIDLASYLHHNKLHIYDIRHYWRKMVEATRLLHERKIVHSDLKPGNFVLVKGRVKIIDFGIAKAIHGNTMNIRRNTIHGTPNYLAPEALNDLLSAVTNNDDDDPDMDPGDREELYKVGPPADIWALGIILYQMVYGVTPFNKYPNKDEAIRKEPVQYPPKSRLGEEVTPELLSVMELCLEKDPTKRPSADRLLRHWFLRS